MTNEDLKEEKTSLVHKNHMECSHYYSQFLQRIRKEKITVPGWGRPVLVMHIIIN